jgi:gas vesicle protein
MWPFKKKKRHDSPDADPADHGDKPENHPKKQKTRVDKLIMGAIVGVAVGSVVGMAMAPQKGKETRKLIAQKGKEAIVLGKKFIDEHANTPEKKQKKSFLKRLFELIFKRKSRGLESLKKIPREHVEKRD